MRSMARTREERYRQQFFSRLEAASSVEEARDLALDYDGLPSSRVVERQLHSNLSFFLFNLTLPISASGDEHQAYLRLGDRLVDAGNLRLEVMEKVKKYGRI